MWYFDLELSSCRNAINVMPFIGFSLSDWRAWLVTFSPLSFLLHAQTSRQSLLSKISMMTLCFASDRECPSSRPGFDAAAISSLSFACRLRAFRYSGDAASLLLYEPGKTFILKQDNSHYWATELRIGIHSPRLLVHWSTIWSLTSVDKFSDDPFLVAFPLILQIVCTITMSFLNQSRNLNLASRQS